MSDGLHNSRRYVVLVRPSRGKPSIHHREAATDDVRAVLEEHGWDKPDKLATALKKRGYVVEVRDFTARQP